MNMNIAICDDESEWRYALINLLRKYGGEKHIDMITTEFSNGLKIISCEKNFDIVFMDYQMNEINGIETARKIHTINSDCIIIFVSAFPQVALDTFEVGTFRFLSKPINKQKLFKALDDYRSSINSDNFLMFNSHDGNIKIKTSEIIYIEADKRHSIIHTDEGSYRVLTNIKTVENKLPKEKFFRCHKSYIASFYHIKSHDSNFILFYDGSKIYISRNYLTSFRTALQEYILKYNSGDIK